MTGPADAFVRYWKKGSSKINKPSNRQGGGHIICSAYAGGGRGGLEVFHHLNKRLSFWGVSQPQLPLFIHFQNNSSLFNLDRIFKASTKIVGGGVINFYVSPSLCACMRVCVCVCV